MQIKIKTTIRHHYEWQKNKQKKPQKQTHHEMLLRIQKNGSLIHCWSEYKMVQQLWKIVWHFLKQ